MQVMLATMKQQGFKDTSSCSNIFLGKTFIRNNDFENRLQRYISFLVINFYDVLG